MNPQLPNFLIVGAMKSGTTTLYEHLERNPSVFMSTPKEPNFFSMDDVYAKGADWYRSLFADAKADQICGEASPSYSRFPRFANTTQRIANLLPEVKLVYIMRHPVDRFYSNYVFDRTYGYRDSIRETINDRQYVLETSNYMLQIEKYLKHFSREQMLFLLLEDLQESPSRVMTELCGFLGISHHSNESEPDQVQANPRGRNYMARQCNTNLQKIRRIPGINLIKKVVPTEIRGRLRDKITQQLPDSRLGKWFSNRHLSKTEPLTSEMRVELLDRLAEPTAQLEQFLGRDLSAWRV